MCYFYGKLGTLSFSQISDLNEVLYSKYILAKFPAPKLFRGFY